MGKVNINTSQNVNISYNPADISDRIIAFLIDMLIMLAIFVALRMVFSEIIVRSDGFDFLLAISSLPFLLYHFISEIALNGQSIGKRSRNIKIVAISGAEPRLSQYMIRWAFRILDVSISFGALAILTIVIGKKGQRLGDLLAGTTVIKLKSQKNFLDKHTINEIEEDYNPVFIEASMLTPKHISIIEKTINAYMDKGDIFLLGSLRDVIVKEMKIEDPPMADLKFLQTILKDYHYLNSMG